MKTCPKVSTQNWQADRCITDPHLTGCIRKYFRSYYAPSQIILTPTATPARYTPAHLPSNCFMTGMYGWAGYKRHMRPWEAYRQRLHRRAGLDHWDCLPRQPGTWLCAETESVSGCRRSGILDRRSTWPENTCVLSEKWAYRGFRSKTIHIPGESKGQHL